LRDDLAQGCETGINRNAFFGTFTLSPRISTDSAAYMVTILETFTPSKIDKMQLTGNRDRCFVTLITIQCVNAGYCPSTIMILFA